ncbi:MAG: hypothetical protein MUC88_21765, partial [Planctomycetes bacterium]|nr:hypothetical protein [Planctomycetota bacterium]
FLESAYIVYAHSVLQQQCRLGYTSPWADQHFGTAERKNAFFEEVGATLQPGHEEILSGLGANVSPNAVLRVVHA